MKREAGILLPITALSSPYGIGCLDQSAYDFVDWLSEAGQTNWQILPLGPTGYGDSPYQSFSSFAGNPYLISLERLIEEGLLSASECQVLAHEEPRIDYGALYRERLPLLYTAFLRAEHSEAQERFEKEHQWWLEDYAMFMAIKQSLGGLPRSEWDGALRERDPSALSACAEMLRKEIEFQKFLQYRFFSDWQRLKNYANRRGIRIIGDLPIYVSADSADVWCQGELFSLNEKGIPLAVAGCPPDGFSPKGQLWGNPLYRWEMHEATGYAWWIRRLSHAFSMCDVLRIDHFRGFDEYYSIPYGAPDAVEGHWEKGPGRALFEAVRSALGDREIIAEDLGYMTDSVRALVRDCGFAGMKILQFGFDGGNFENEYLPHNYPEQSVAYTGTHDNPTLRSWLKDLSDEEEQMLRSYLWDRHTPDKELLDVLIALMMRSRSRMAIVPMQDYLGLGAEGRINRPSTTGENWRWRMDRNALSEELCRKVYRLTEIGGRLRRKEGS